MRKLRKDQKGQIGIGTMIVFIAMVLIAAIAAAVMIGVSNELQHRAKATGMEAVKTSSTGITVDSILGYAEMIPGPISKVGIYIRPYAGGEYVSIASMSIEFRVKENVYTYRYNSAFFDPAPPGNIFESRAWPTVGAGEAERIQEEIAALEAELEKEEGRRRPREDRIAELESQIAALRAELLAVPAAGLDAFGCIALSDADRSMATGFPAMTPGDVAILTVTTGGRLGNIGDRITVDGKIYCEAGVPAVIRFTTPSGVPHKVFDLM